MPSNDTEQRYFLICSSDYGRVSSALWAADDQAGRQRTLLNLSGDNRAATLWTENLGAQPRLRQILVSLGVRFQEGPNQQVRSWLQNYF